MALLSNKCIMSAMAALMFLLLAAFWHQVNAQIDLERNQRHQLSVASISSMDFYKPDRLSHFKNQAEWQQPPLPVNANNRKRPRFRAPGRPKQPTARPRHHSQQPVQETNHARHSDYDYIQEEDKQEQYESEELETLKEYEDGEEEAVPRVLPTEGTSFKLIKTFDEDGVHVPLSILRAFQQPKSATYPPRSGKSVSSSSTKDQLPIDDQVISAIHSKTQLEHELTPTTRQPTPEANHHNHQLSGARTRLAPVPKAVDNHSGSYGLTAASVYARSQPSLRRLNQEPREIERPRPYRQRPISSSTVAPRKAQHDINLSINTKAETETEFQYGGEFSKKSLASTSESARNRVEFAEDQLDNSEEVVEEEEAEEIKQGSPQTVNIIPKSKPPPESTMTDIKSLLRNAGSQSLSEILQQKGMKLSDLLKGGRPLPFSELDPESQTMKSTTAATSLPPETTPVDIKSLLRNTGSQSLSEILQQKGMKLSDLLKGGRPLSSSELGRESKTMKSTTTTTSPPPETTTTDIKSLLRNAGSQSLSEILQQKGMKLSDLLKGGEALSSIRLDPESTTMKSITTTSIPPETTPVDIKSLLQNAGSQSLSEVLQQKGMKLSDLLKGGQTSSPAKSMTTTTSGPPLKPIPSAQPISIRELLASAKISLKELVTKKPSASPDGQPIPPLTKPTNAKDFLEPNPTIKPGVKRPRPFVPGRSQQFSLPPSTTPSIDVIEENRTDSPSPTPKIYKDTSHLQPLVFGEKVTESTTIRARASSPRPYIVGNNVGEYGIHIVSDDDDDDDDSISTFSNVVSYGTYNNHGNRRPIATSRLTPAPPRSVKRRPVFTYNYSAFSEEDYSDSEETVETTPLILTHFNEEEMREEEAPYFNLPLSVRNALTFSFYIAGFSLFVFLVIFVLFKVRQKSRIRLRYPLALLANTKNNSTTDVSSSDVSTPNPKPRKVSTYAKLPQRSNSLWGTLRRSVKRMENI